MWDNQWTSREKKLAGVMGVLVLIMVGFFVMRDWTGTKSTEGEWKTYEGQLAKKKSEKESSPPVKQSSPSSAELVVDVKGAVKKPGVYHLQAGSRVEDAVKIAGGEGAKADMIQVNLAQPLTDGMALIIPHKGEDLSQSFLNAETKKSKTSSGNVPVDLNQASVEDLDSLNGIGPAKAEAILRYREEHGPFTSVDQLKEVQGIGEKTIALFKSQVTVH
ncbi:helix-hairpin-helix domain-containing protein [Marininema halotolerans]|uniref:Competence protein ComEA n=1 Tax=Marininema halotolerans TaxID=1155944 RepID=A0A1I6RYA0_9BACL|nr:helix-hairpin-helix domain-containing protein [Marininema halotolerans]SFS69664.1 competence protein ComEA [Marininema halotolerans]